MDELEQLLEAIRRARTVPDFINKGKGLWNRFSSRERIHVHLGATAVLDAIDSALDDKTYENTQITE